MVLLISLVFLLLAWWGARIISRPLEVLTGLALRVEQGEEDVQLDPGARSAEVGARQRASLTSLPELFERNGRQAV